MSGTPGHRQLNPQEVELVAEVKEQGNNLGAALDVLGQIDAIDQRALSIARTHLQTGLMWLTRAITRPEGFA